MLHTIFAAALIARLAVIPTTALAQGAGVNAGVNAAVTTPVGGVNASVSAKVTAAKAKATKEIDRRIALLADMQARIQTMQKVTDAFKQNLSAAVQTQTTALQTLKTKIDAETDEAVIKADVQSITQSHQIFALFMPQARIAAMADREVVLANMMATLGAKLQARVVAAQTAGAEVAALNLALTELNTKINSANTQAQAAVSASAVLSPDNNDKTKMAANAAALKAARTNLQAAHKDLQDARKAIQTILDGLKKAEASVTATTTAQVQ